MIIDHQNTSRKILISLLSLLVLVVIAIGTFLFVSQQQQTTELRSKATKNDTASLSVVSTDTGSGTDVSLISAMSGLDPQVAIHSIQATISIVAKKESVLGATTESFLRIASQPNASVTGKTRICLSDVIEDASKGKLFWGTTCKGNTSSSTSCTKSGILELSGGEVTLYDSWKTMGKPTSSTCVEITKAEIDAPAPTYIHPLEPKATPVKSVISTPKPSISLYNENQIQITTDQDGVRFSSPAVQLDQANQSVQISLTLAVPNTSVSDSLHRDSTLARIHLPKLPAGFVYQATLARQSVRGTRPIAPGVEVELTTPGQTPSPTITPTPAVVSTNLLTNPSFESGILTPWSANIAQNAGTVILEKAGKDGGYSARMNTTTAFPNNNWYAQLLQDVSLQSGKTYALSFLAKGTASSKVTVNIQKHASPYTVYKAQTFTLSSDWQTYSLSYTAGATDAQAMINFNSATNIGSVWLDDVSFQ